MNTRAWLVVLAVGLGLGCGPNAGGSNTTTTGTQSGGNGDGASTGGNGSAAELTGVGIALDVQPKEAKVTIDDSSTVIQVESDERLDAIVRPDVVRLKVQRFWGPHGHPKPEGPLKGKEGRYGPPRTGRG